MPLTRREFEVAGLVAAGLTNKEIASRLFISERTVDGHLEHIREKLGMNSRAQVAAWFVERTHAGPTPTVLNTAPPNNLPYQLTSFVGREADLVELREVLASTRLLTLTGAGGCGKTRLALQVAADTLDCYREGGVWWVELAALAEEELVESALATALGVRPLPGRSALEATLDRLEGSRALVLLDNCEHLLGAVAQIAEGLLRGCPDVTVIVTSRAPLGVSGETCWRVPSLSLPAEGGSESLDGLAHYDAVRLFVERAMKVRPHFAVSMDNAPAIARICRDLDGIPLAIELAAARVRVLSTEQIAVGLGNRFRLLTGGLRTALPRQQTLRASVDWSHELLSHQERVFFRRLAAFAGGWTLDAVELVCAGEGLDRHAILDLLTSLVDKSLVVVEERGPLVRYRLLETVRHYALDLLTESGELGAVRDRHREAYLELAERVEPDLLSARQRQGLDILDPEAANLAAAIDWAAETDPEQALRLCSALTFWWKLRGMFGPADAAYRRALDAANPAPSNVRARVLWGRAYVGCFGGDYRGAIGAAWEALEVARELGDKSVMARALDMLGILWLFHDPIGCRPDLRRSIELAREAGDNWCLADATQNLGQSHLLCEEFDDGERLHQQALPIIEQMNYAESLAWHWWSLTWRPFFRADVEQATDFAERTLNAARQVGEPVSEGFAQATLGMLEVAQGRADAALERLEASLKQVVALGAGIALPMIELAIAFALGALGRFSQAQARLEARIAAEALASISRASPAVSRTWQTNALRHSPLVATGVDLGYILSWALIQLADTLRAGGDAAGAEQRAREGLDIAQRLGSRQLIGRGHELLGRLAAADDRWGVADQLLRQALDAYAAASIRIWMPSTLDALAKVAAGLESHEEAARVLGVGERAYADLGLVRWPPDQPGVDALQGELQRVLGEEAFERARGEGAALTLDEAIGWLRRAGGGRQRPSGGWESLTPSELRVVELVAEGLTNAQIGERLVISRAIVEFLLAHVFQKLDVKTRTELSIKAAGRQGYVEPETSLGLDGPSGSPAGE